MNLLPAYQALLTSPADLAACRQAVTVDQLLGRLRSLWGIESMADGPLIAVLNHCNRQVLDIDPRRLEGQWFAHGYDARTRSLAWCLPEGHPTEPFLDQYVERCLQATAFNQLVRPRTSLDCASSGPAPVPPRSAGFIFHLSRCGSTLVSGCLAELDTTCVLSESPLLTQVLLDASLDDERKRDLLPGLIRLQASAFPKRDRIVVKWNAWDLMAWPLILEACPGVPALLLSRDPEQILASHARLPGRHMSGDPSLAHLHPAFAPAAADESLLDRRIGVLKVLQEAMSLLGRQADAMAVDYARLDAACIDDICRYFALATDAAGRARMRQRMSFHSKHPGHRFEADGAKKERFFDADDRSRIRRGLAT